MPETVNGYELFQLCLGKEPEESITFAEYNTDIGVDGFGVSVLYGADTGRRRWKLNFPILAGASGQTSITANGMTLTQEAYLWDLFCRSKVSGQPFVVQSPRNDQYYLAKFTDTTLSYTRMLSKLFSTGLELAQVRIPGVSVFDISKVPGVVDYYDDSSYFAGMGSGWTDTIDGAIAGPDFLTTSGDVIVESAEQNDLDVLRLNSAGGSGFMARSDSVVAHEILIVMKVREATFSNFGGLITAATGTAALLGDSGETKFFNIGFAAGDFEYRLNGVLYAQDDQQAPMEEWGLVHLRFPNGLGLTNMQVGKDRAATDRYAKIDVGALAIVDATVPLSTIREIAEDLQTRWDV